ncbi:Protein-L-isoaspartate(D-aspartate) O-methyltransferase [Pseudorhizobium banfieldiae]|uniref:Protein-L-isoaspartate O-methyltransferase n=2 Tax=Pseudorhizobium banfieldiae TaxID=1125847 RepID=L0NDZ8_9HYPH|nr:protein-L-isoaspartate O-methyltransferase [arsenite-oxidising bacterium NT-25]CCF19285.1 Protein-L-isoaspartate(D-aspartate) O-methyltransferase [Pseudorhizobium banfieldiae]
MMDFEAARTKMVDNQIRTTDVTSHSVLQAFLSVPREEFVPAKLKPIAYIDEDLEIATGRYLMEASPLAKLLQLARIGKDDLALEVGCGTGYAAALLSQLAGSVVSVEADEQLCSQAVEILSRLGYDNVAVVHGEMEKGYPTEAPYDIIFVNGAVEEVPAALIEQLRDGGRLVAVVGHGNAAQARLLTKEHGAISETAHFNTSVKQLPGFQKEPSFVF